jgi:hypothetical protein
VPARKSPSALGRLLHVFAVDGPTANTGTFTLAQVANLVAGPPIRFASAIRLYESEPK